LIDKDSNLAYKKLCKTTEVPIGELRVFHILKKDILVANSKGQFHCLSPLCTHAGAPLVKGVLNDNELECPWHYGSFRITDGTVIYGEPKEPLQVYSCIVKGDYLFVDL
jgi:nitrite reductase/ring-hydroxylating ferredoxin subunit